MYRLFAYLLLFGFSFCLAHAQTAPTDAVVGHVTGMSGSWRDESCQCSVDQGHTVVRRSKIVRQGAGVPTNFIKIRLWSNQKEELFDCGKIDCKETLDVLARVPADEKPSQLASFLRAALEVVRENLSTDGEERRTLSGYARALSRGLAEVPLSDGFVAPEADGTVELSAVFAKASAGTYQLDWCAVDRDSVVVGLVEVGFG